MRKRILSLYASILIVLVGFLPTAHAESIKGHTCKSMLGVTSYYGKGFRGRKMANGERFDERDVTVIANKECPLGTKVIAVNPETGASLKMEVQDRGPYTKGRTFDLSKAAYIHLGIDLKKGTSLLLVQVITDF